MTEGTITNNPSLPMGWICPICEKCWSPFIYACDCFPPAVYASGTYDPSITAPVVIINPNTTCENK